MDELLLGLRYLSPLCSVSSLSLESMSGACVTLGVPSAVLGRGIDGRGPIRPPPTARPLLDGSGC